MRLVAISDTHNQHSELSVPDGDILIHAGDATNRGTYNELMDFLCWFDIQPHTYRIFVPGNHDRNILKDLLFWRRQFPTIDIWSHDSKVIENHMFVGSAAMWTYGENISLLPKPDILITHNAPFEILDAVPEKLIEGNSDALLSIGDKNILQFVKANQPKIHLFGHIHLHGGKHININNTTYYNLAACNEEGYIENTDFLQLDV